jgi:hypothetical protein
MRPVLLSCLAAGFLAAGANAAPVNKPGLAKQPSEVVLAQYRGGGMSGPGRMGGAPGIGMRAPSMRFGNVGSIGRAYRGGVPRQAYRYAPGVNRFYGRRHVHPRRFRNYAFYGAPFVYGYYGGEGCGWLRRRAIRTGSAYWWRRYQACRDYHY